MDTRAQSADLLEQRSLVIRPNGSVEALHVVLLQVPSHQSPRRFALIYPRQWGQA